MLFLISFTLVNVEGCGFLTRFNDQYPTYQFSKAKFGSVSSDCCAYLGKVKTCSVSGSFVFSKSILCGSPWFYKIETLKGSNITQQLYDTYLQQEELAWLKCDVITPSKTPSPPSNCTFSHSSLTTDTSVVVSFSSTCPGSYACTNGQSNKHASFETSSDVSFPKNDLLPIFCSVAYGTAEDNFLVGTQPDDLCIYYGITSIHSFILCNYPLLKFIFYAFVILIVIKLMKRLSRLLIITIVWITVLIQIIRGKRVWEHQASRTVNTKEGSVKMKVFTILGLIFSFAFDPSSAALAYKDTSITSTVSVSNVTVCDNEHCSVNMVVSFVLPPVPGACYVYKYTDDRFQPVTNRICVDDFYHLYPLQEEYYTMEPNYSHYFDGYCIGSPIVTCPAPEKYGFVSNFYFNSDINQGCWIWGQTDICTTTNIDFSPYRSTVYTVSEGIPSLSLSSFTTVDGIVTDTKVLGTVDVKGQFSSSPPFELTNGRKIVVTPTGVDVAFAPSKFEVLPFRWGSYQFSDTAQFFPPNPIKYTNCKGPKNGFGCVMEIPDYSYSSTLPKSLSEYVLGKSLAYVKSQNLIVKPLQPPSYLVTLNTNFTVSLVTDQPCPSVQSYKVLTHFYGLGQTNPVEINAITTCSQGFAKVTAVGCTVNPTSKCFLTESTQPCSVDVVFPNTNGECIIYLQGKTTSSVSLEYALIKDITLTNQTTTKTEESNPGSINNGVGFLESSFGVPNYVWYLIIPLAAIALITFALSLYKTMKGDISRYTKTKLGKSF